MQQWASPLMRIQNLMIKSESKIEGVDLWKSWDHVCGFFFCRIVIGDQLYSCENALEDFDEAVSDFLCVLVLHVLWQPKQWSPNGSMSLPQIQVSLSLAGHSSSRSFRLRLILKFSLRILC